MSLRTALMYTFTDPISHQRMQDSVIIECGHTFERKQLNGWSQKNVTPGGVPTCPLCKAPFKNLVPNMLINKALVVLVRLEDEMFRARVSFFEEDRENIQRAIHHATERRAADRAKKIPDSVPSTQNFIARAFNGEPKFDDARIQMLLAGKQKEINLGEPTTDQTTTAPMESNSSGSLCLNANPPIAEWEGARKVSLFQEENRLAFSTEGRSGTKHPFDPSPYNIYYAANLIAMFQNTIGANIKDDDLNPSCFIPLFCVDAGIERSPRNSHYGIGKIAQIALFGRVAPQDGDKPGVLKGLRWGVFYHVLESNQALDVEDDCTREYIRWAPAESMRNLEEMSAYTKRFSVMVKENDFASSYREMVESNDFMSRLLLPLWEALSSSYNNPYDDSIEKISLKYQRSWYESGGRSCPGALMNYLSLCEQASLQVLRQLGLAPEQIASYCTDVEWAYFRTLMLQLDKQPEEKQQSIFKNLEKQYPTIFPTLLEELRSHLRSLDKSESEYESILATLNKGVKGQNTATELLASALNTQKNTDKNTVFLFVGPSGVGKTELAKVGASLKQNRFVKFDMDQFKGEVDFYKLFGAPAGHVGSTDLPLFATALNPYASPLTKNADSTFTRVVTDTIVLFDEFEKAHSEVKQSFLTLFDENYCKIQYTSEKKNCVVLYKFKRCIFIATSNLYKQEILEDFRQGVAPKDIATHFKTLNIEKPQKDSYSPELLARMTPVPFGPVPRGEIYRSLIQSKLPSFLDTLQASVRSSKVIISEVDLPKVLGLLETKLYGDGTGLRNVKQYFENEITTCINKQTSWGDLTLKQINIIPFDNDKLGVKCITEKYGRIIEEYPPVPIEDSGIVDIL